MQYLLLHIAYIPQQPPITTYNTIQFLIIFCRGANSLVPVQHSHFVFYIFPTIYLLQPYKPWFYRSFDQMQSQLFILAVLFPWHTLLPHLCMAFSFLLFCSHSNITTPKGNYFSMPLCCFIFLPRNYMEFYYLFACLYHISS
jgi:hypothetical protein